MEIKISVYIATSFDGYIARTNGGLDWLEGSGENESNISDTNEGNSEDYGYDEFMESIDVLVMGRNTFEKVLSFGQWPYENKRVMVLGSKRLKIPNDLSKTVESRSCTPEELVIELKEAGAKHLYVDGGKTIQSFLEAGLINELIVTKAPILIGSGIPLFGPLSMDKKLTHIETRSFKNGFVQSKYTI